MIQEELDEWNYSQSIQIELQISEANLEAYFESLQNGRKLEIAGGMSGYEAAMENDMVKEIVAGLCGRRASADFRTNIIMAAYHANVLAHNGYEGFYRVKSYLLEHVCENRIWVKKPYDCYGIGGDEYGNAVAYFDVPGCGQVSFHLVSTHYDENVPSYPFEWCETRNDRFPSYACIKNCYNCSCNICFWHCNRPCD